MTTPNAEITCLVCGRTGNQRRTSRGAARLPKGWKRFAKYPYCPRCFRETFVRRLVTLPVVGPVDGDWPTLRQAVQQMWNATTEAANWMSTQYYVRDVRRRSHDVRLGKVPHIYLYPEARLLWPQLPSNTVAALEHEVRLKYLASRYDLVWTCRRPLPTYRYPVPFSIPAKYWTLTSQNNRWQVSVPMAGRHWTLRLRGGAHMWRQVAFLEQLGQGKAQDAHLSLYQRTVRVSDHRTEAFRGTRLMCRISAHFPRTLQTEAQHTLHVRTTPESFLVATLGKDDWHLMGHQVRRWLAHDERLRRGIVVDLKGVRASRDEQRGLLERLGKIAGRSRNRLRTWCHEAARRVVDYAVRRRVSLIVYDDHSRDFVQQFPWTLLARFIQEKANQHGITVVLSNHVGATTPRDSSASA